VMFSIVCKLCDATRRVRRVGTTVYRVCRNCDLPEAMVGVVPDDRRRG